MYSDKEILAQPDYYYARVTLGRCHYKAFDGKTVEEALQAARDAGHTSANGPRRVCVYAVRGTQGTLEGSYEL